MKLSISASIFRNETLISTYASTQRYNPKINIGNFTAMRTSNVIYEDCFHSEISGKFKAYYLEIQVFSFPFNTA